MAVTFIVIGIVFLLLIVLISLGVKANVVVDIENRCSFFNVYIFGNVLCLIGRVFIDKNRLFLKLNNREFKEIKSVSTEGGGLKGFPTIKVAELVLNYSLGDKDDAYGTVMGAIWSNLILNLLTSNLLPKIDFEGKTIRVSPSFTKDQNKLSLNAKIKISLPKIILFLLHKLLKKPKANEKKKYDKEKKDVKQH